jgi:hypothetical protein
VDISEQLEAFWSGEQPTQIPYTIYHTKVADGNDDRAWEALFAKGLGLTYKWYPFKLETRDLVTLEQARTEHGKQIRRVVQRTAVGEIWAEWADNWQQKYWLETPEDYRVMTHIVKNTIVLPDLENFRAKESELPSYAVAWSMIGRTPLQEILVDYVGLEKFSLHLFDYEEEVRELYDALLTNFRQKVMIAAQSPGKFVSNLENFTAETLGPKRYAEFLLPVYEECFPILHDAGKIIGTHYDGRTKSCRDLIARAPIDVIESLTTPPEGDQALAECRAVWPNKLFWCNINVSAYSLSSVELRELLTTLVEQGAPDGRRLAFEVSEALPANWKDSILVVLDILREMRA